MLTLKTPTVKKNAFGLKNANDNANAKLVGSLTLRIPIAFVWKTIQRALARGG